MWSNKGRNFNEFLKASAFAENLVVSGNDDVFLYSSEMDSVPVNVSELMKEPF